MTGPVDWDAHVIGPVMGVFGETVAYTPVGRTPFTITGVFDEAYHSIIMLDNGPGIVTEAPVLGVRLSQFPAGIEPRKNDTVAIPRVGTIYVVGEVHKDGHGHAKLKLNVKAAMS